jgi:uncharacterized protein (DUF2062 family)
MLATLKQRIRDVWNKLARIRATPRQIAAGFALGFFVSFLPIIPLRTLVAIALAWLLRQNVAAAFVGKSITLLYWPVVPFLWNAEYRLGIHINPVEKPLVFDRAHLGEIFHMGWDVFAATFIGGVLIGAPVALLSYIILLPLTRKWKLRRPVPSS